MKRNTPFILGVFVLLVFAALFVNERFFDSCMSSDAVRVTKYWKRQYVILDALKTLKNQTGEYPKSDERLSSLVLLEGGLFSGQPEEAHVLEDSFMDLVNAKPAMVRYWSDGASFILSGAGPDCEYDIDLFRLSSDYESPLTDDVLAGLASFSYAPTNGTVSDGDIIFTNRSTYTMPGKNTGHGI